MKCNKTGASEVQSMPHSVFFCLQVVVVIFIWGYLDGHILHYLQPIRLEPHPRLILCTPRCLSICAPHP